MAELEEFDQFALGVARESWQLFRRDPAMFVIAWVLMFLGSCFSFGLLAGTLHVGFIELCRRARRGEPISASILFSRFDALVPSLIAFLVLTIAIAIGLFLLVVPGLVIALFAIFTLHVIAYESLSGVDAIRRSYELVRESPVHVLALLVLVALAQALGGMILLGVLLTYPLSLIALTIGYERLGGLAPTPALAAF
ncbi:MAG: hypothetical protein JWN04_2159 [Myxococcaceae bacterium]|nr:hypothetical protein [Myxococcaceae bacterium]